MGGTLRALIIDDSEEDAELLAIELKRSGFELVHRHVETANELRAAIDDEVWDVVLSDYSMPGFSGIAALEIVRSRKPGLPFIIVSGTVGEDLAVEAMKLGANDFVLKDKLARLGGAVRRELNEAASRRARHEAERTVALYQEVFENVRVGIAVLVWESPPDLGSFRIVAANAALMHALHAPSLDFVGQCLRDSFPSLLETDVPRTLAEVIQCGESRSLPALRYGNGTVSDGVFSLKVVPLGEGRVVFISEDITEQVRAQEEEKRLSAAIGQASEAIIITDVGARIQYVNPAFERSSGYTHREVIGKNPRFLRSGAQDREFYERMWSVLTRGDTWRGRLVNKRKDGALYTEDATITPVRDASGRLTNYVAVKRDVTRELKLEEQMYASQRMEAVGRLAGGIAHDFNNLLTAIMSFGTFAFEGLDQDDPAREDVEEILSAARRAEQLTRQLLTFSRRQPVQPTTLQIGALVKGLDKMLQRVIGEDIYLQTKISDALWNVTMDGSALEQVIVNLAVNARDALPTSGKLTIEAENVTLTEAYSATRGTSVPVGDYVLLAVTDDGVGIPPEVRDRIFEPFFTTKERGKGTGLGLATCYGIVKQAGGYIWVYSELGHGTTFKIYLPRTHSSVGEVGERSSDRPVSGNEVILVVEDDAQIRALVVRTLAGLGYEVLVAENGREALLAIQGAGRSIDLLLTDVVMPTMGGRQLVQELSALLPELRVLYMSGYTADTIARQGILDPGVSLLQKPFAPTSLARKVRDCLDGDGYRARDVAPTPHVLLIDDDELVLAALKRALGESFDVEVARDGQAALETITRNDFQLILCDVVMPRIDGVELYGMVCAAKPDVARRFVFFSGAIDAATKAEIANRTGRSVLKKPLDLERVKRLVEEAH